MDTQLLRCFDKAQDIDALYKEILRNCDIKTWYWHTSSNTWRCIDYLDMNFKLEECILCETNNTKWIVEKWINLT